MSTTNQTYVSGGVPFGAVSVSVYRLADVDDNNSGALLGTYKLESLTLGGSDILNKRPDVDGGKNGWWIVSGDREGSCVLQRSVATSPSILPGDYFSVSLRVDSAGTPVAERVVIYNPSESFDASYRKVSASCIVDAAA
jgi:hypothetical protein